MSTTQEIPTTSPIGHSTPRVDGPLKVSGKAQAVLVRIALQEYTLAETAELTGMSVRTVVRRYTEALDRLTQVFLRRKLLQVPGGC